MSQMNVTGLVKRFLPTSLQLKLQRMLIHWHFCSIWWGFSGRSLTSEHSTLIMTLSTWECDLYLPIELELVTYTIAETITPTIRRKSQVSKTTTLICAIRLTTLYPKVPHYFRYLLSQWQKTVVKFSLRLQHEWKNAVIVTETGLTPVVICMGT